MKISSDYRSMLSAIAREKGRGTARAIRQEAQAGLDELIQGCPHLPKGERSHVHGYIFPRAALYRAMERHLGPQSAMEYLDAAIDQRGQKMGKALRHLTALPFMKGLFLRIFASMAKTMFGAEGGFEQKFYPSPKGEVRFDILDCTYCRWCRRCGCPEIIHTFCESDEHCFGHLTGIEFVRTQTLEQGEKCDFALVRTKRGRK